jgi:hypothetical protein
VKVYLCDICKARRDESSKGWEYVYTKLGMCHICGECMKKHSGAVWNDVVKPKETK